MNRRRGGSVRDAVSHTPGTHSVDLCRKSAYAPWLVDFIRLLCPTPRYTSGISPSADSSAGSSLTKRSAGPAPPFRSCSSAESHGRYRVYPSSGRAGTAQEHPQTRSENVCLFSAGHAPCSMSAFGISAVAGGISDSPPACSLSGTGPPVLLQAGPPRLQNSGFRPGRRPAG